jgi:hypothetical protein
MFIKKGRELKVGDIIHDQGIIYKLKRRSSTQGFWEGKPYMCYFDINDSGDGPLCGSFDLDKEYIIEDDRKVIVDIFKKIDRELARFIAEHMEYRKKLGYIHNRILKKYPIRRNDDI